jgi:hypothetical protein
MDRNNQVKYRRSVILVGEEVSSTVQLTRAEKQFVSTGNSTDY